MSKYDVMTSGEAAGVSLSKPLAVDEERNELNMIFQFDSSASIATTGDGNMDLASSESNLHALDRDWTRTVGIPSIYPTR